MANGTQEPAKYQNIELAFRTLNQECTRCAAELRPEWQFCAHCDARLATECPACGVPLPPAGATHCGHCGLVFLRQV